ncbi:MAG: hypothetical protein AAB533_00130, partial [Patescibacteria group bacterium]
MGPTIGLVALLLGAGMALEGLDRLTGGEVYLASVRQLAQAGSSTLPQESPAPPAPSSPDQAPAPVPQAPQPSPPQPPPPPPSEPSGHSPGPQGQGETGESEEGPQDFVDPREVQQVLREIKDLRSQIRQIANRVRKNAAFSDESARLAAIAAELDRAQTAIKSASPTGGALRDAVQDFRDAQYWDEMNKIRAKVELPNEIKQIETSVKRLERLLTVKSVQNIGLNLETVRARASEMREHAAAVRAHLASGNLEEAMEEMQFFHESGHPGEIEGTIFRLRDIKQMLKRVKDEQIRAEVDKVLQEVVDAFNAGEYRDARETLDEYADDLQRLIQRFFTLQMQKGRNREDSFSRIRNLDALIRAKLEEPDQ